MHLIWIGTQKRPSLQTTRVQATTNFSRYDVSWMRSRASSVLPMRPEDRIHGVWLEAAFCQEGASGTLRSAQEIKSD